MKKLVFILIILIASISVVSAGSGDGEAYPTSANVTIMINDSFTDLNDEINSVDELNMTLDYKFYTENDTSFEDGISIEKNITINGNNHIIDGKGKARIFNIVSSNVVLNNLVIKNARINAIYAVDSNVTTNNVTFINNTALTSGACVYGLNTSYTSINDKFLENHAKYGSGIFSFSGKITIINASFENRLVNRGLIGIHSTEIMIINTTFSNVTSNYTGILYSVNSKGIIKNSRFINLCADKTGGAMAFIGLNGTLTIDNCTFINSSSRKNGGAVYSDLGTSETESVTLKNTNFINCSSDFGGAYMQLGGKLNIENSTFTSSKNPLYLSDTRLTIADSEFSENTEGLYIDNSSLRIISSRFIKSEIALYDSFYQISKSLFNSSDISTYFDVKNSYLKDNTYIGSKTVLNQKQYTTSISNNLETIYSYTPTIFLDDAVYKSYFNLNDYGLVGPVKNQLNSGSCWAFAVASSFESALLKMGINLTISEHNMRNLALKYSKYGVNFITDGGDFDYAVSYLLSWLGEVSQEDDDFDDLGKVSNIFNHGHYAFNVINVDWDIQSIKKAIINYGALYASIIADYDDEDYYNENTSSAYYDRWGFFSNHAVCVVGWDDTFSKYNFNTVPKGDGAWIVKNSWGSDWGDGGYYYVSYYDYSITPSWAFEILPEVYDKIYQHDFISYLDYFSPNYEDLEFTYGNYYVATGNDLISAVGTYTFFEGDFYTINIYINDKLVYTQEGEVKQEGFTVIKLNSQISVNKNDKFRVELTTPDIPVAIYSRTIYQPNTSYYMVNNKMKFFSSNTTAIIKVYTIPNPITTRNVVTYYSTSKTTFTVKGLSGTSIVIKVDGKKYTVKIKDKTATLKIKLKKGNHIVVTPYNGKKIINQILVKSSVRCLRNVKVVYKSKNTLTVKYVDANEKPIKNKKIKLTMDKKIIKGRTDAKGIFKVKLSKLKKGKHTIKLTHPVNGEKVKVNVKVISRFRAKNMKMYYFDGSVYKFKVLKDNGKVASKGLKVKVKLDNKTYNLKTDKKGQIKVKIGKKILPGKHTIKIKAKADSVKHTLTVKNIIKSVNVKKTSKKLILKAKLKKKLNNKKVTFKINGKKYSAKTSKGVAKVKVKKPKKGEYKLKVGYYKTGVKKIVRV